MLQFFLFEIENNFKNHSIQTFQTELNNLAQVIGVKSNGFAPILDLKLKNNFMNPATKTSSLMPCPQIVTAGNSIYKKILVEIQNQRNIFCSWVSQFNPLIIFDQDLNLTFNLVFRSMLL